MGGHSLCPVPNTTTEVQRAWGEVIRLERHRQRLNQTEVAKRAGTDQKVVSKVENGAATLDTTVRIAAALGLTVTDLTEQADGAVA
jgi:HTH-type transcriptional regulator/antitoxin HipB